MFLTFTILLAMVHLSTQASFDCKATVVMRVNNIGLSFGQNVAGVTSWWLWIDGKMHFENLQIYSNSSNDNPYMISSTNCQGRPMYRWTDKSWDRKLGQEVTYRISGNDTTGNNYTAEYKVTPQAYLNFAAPTELELKQIPATLTADNPKVTAVEVSWKKVDLSWLPVNKQTALSPRYEVRACDQLSSLPDQGKGSAQGCNYEPENYASVHRSMSEYSYKNSSMQEGEEIYFDVRLNSEWGRSDPITKKIVVKKYSAASSAKVSLLVLMMVVLLSLNV